MAVVNIIISGLLTGGIYALIAVGFNLQYGVARVLNVAHGEFIMLGAMGAVWLYLAFGINPFITLVIWAPISCLIGLLLHKGIYEGVRKVSPSTDIFESRSMLASFGLIYVLQNIAILAWGADVKNYSFLAFPIHFLGMTIAANRLTVLIFALVAVIAFYIFLIRTRLGKAIRAAAQEAISAQIVGVNIKWMHALCFSLGIVMAGLGGVFISMLFAVSPFIGMQYTIISLIVVVMGGLGNIPGSLVGGLILGIIGSITQNFEPALQMVVFYAIFMLLILIRPKGILGR